MAAGSKPRRRGDLTRERIVAESLRLLDADGVAGFSFPKLGRALAVDPTAVYRYFASKDDLVLAVADALIEDSLDGLEPTECWVETLELGFRRLRVAYHAHPAAASITSYRTTRGPAEMTAVNSIIDAMLRAGFEGERAAAVYRAFGDFTLFWCGGEASFLALEEQLRERDQDAWTSAYLTADQAKYPAIWQVREHLAEVERRQDTIADAALSIMLSGLQAQAPKPCDCIRHAGG